MGRQNQWLQAIDFENKVKTAFFTLWVLTNQGGFVQRLLS
jgi:hypothetical protein